MHDPDVNILTVSYAWVYHCYFPHYRFGGGCIHTGLGPSCLFTLFWWCQRGEDKHGLSLN